MPGLSDVESMQDFVSNSGVEGFPHIPDLDTGLWSRFDVNRHHTYVLLNDDGTARQTDYGSLRSDVEELIQK